MSRTPRTKIARRRAIFAIASGRGVSFTVAAHILDCMRSQKRANFLNKFRPSDEEWEQMKKQENRA